MPDTNYTTTALRVRKALRVFRCDFICHYCDTEFCDELLTAGPSWCIACDAECEPYLTTEFEEEMDETDEEDDE